MANAGLTSSFALDLQGVDGLKRLAKSDSEKGATEAARQFEALFIQRLLKSARESTPKSGLLDSEQTQFYNELADQQMAQTLAGKGLGMAEQIAADMKAKGLIDGSQDEYQEKLIAGIPKANPRALTNSIALTGGEAATNAAEQQRTIGVRLLDQSNDDNRPDHVAQFVSKLAPTALKASEKSGVPAELILAQAALETGWGRHQIRTASGGESYNLFGIKAGDHWTGKTAKVVTTEYVKGEPVKQVEEFRAYNSYDEAFTDYARLIAGSPRYEKVSTAPTAKAAAFALQSSGYATDPAYARKLVAVMDSMGPVESKSKVSAASLFGSDDRMSTATQVASKQ
ncbi:flagellar assembly peptidoglycan hydrolase FlgJ [Pseudomonas aeruginosa]